MGPPGLLSTLANDGKARSSNSAATLALQRHRRRARARRPPINRAQPFGLHTLINNLCIKIWHIDFGVQNVKRIDRKDVVGNDDQMSQLARLD